MVEINVRTFNGSQFPHVSIGVLTRNVDQHDSFQLVAVGKQDSTLRDSFPVQATWVDTTGSRVEFYGYIDMQNPTRAPKVGSNEYVIMGPTYVMRNGSARAWQRRLAHEILLEVMGPYKLAAEYDTYDIPIEYISQSATESDWQLLVKLADKIGYSLASEGVVVRFVDPGREGRRAAAGGYTPVSIPSGDLLNNSGVSSFSVTATTTPTGSGYKDFFISGVDRLGQRFSYKPSYAPVQRQDIVPEVEAPFAGAVASLRDAMIEADRINRMSRWTQRADMSVVGKMNASPGRSMMIVDGAKQYSGMWHVVGAQTVIMADDNATSADIVLCRDGAAAERLQVPPVSRWRTPSPRLVNGRWQADRFWARTLS